MRSYTIIAMALWACIVHAEKLVPFNSTEIQSVLAPEENRVWAQAEEIKQSIEKSDKLVTDNAIRVYLHAIADKLYPELRNKVHIHLFRAPHLNAFALPNGQIYLNVGLIARMENEAQLAALLGHEIAHFSYRHGHQQSQQVKSATAFARFVTLLGLPLIPDLLAISSIYGFSQELETEADEIGFERMVRAGYDPREAVRLFRLLQIEVKALDITEPFFFASHPKLQDRIDNFERLIREKGITDGEHSEKTFFEQIAHLRLHAMELDLAHNRYQPIIILLEAQSNLDRYPPEALYYLGEAYLRRGQEGDLQKAIKSFEQTTASVPTFALAHRALGMLRYKDRTHETAIPHLERYLELAPQAKDRAFVEHYLLEARKVHKP